MASGVVASGADVAAAGTPPPAGAPADVRLLSDSRGQGEALVARSAAPLPHRVRATAPEEFSMDLIPAKQVVRATVEARFTMAEPDLAAVDTGTRRARPAPGRRVKAR